MNPLLRSVAAVVAALLLGALASHYLAASPAAVRAQAQPAVTWSEGWAPEPDPADAVSVWQSASPWGATPATAAEALPPPPPAPVPVGVAKEGRNYLAIFQVNGNGVMRLRAGGRLPDGGQVVQVTGRRIVWLDADGKRQQREIFNDFQGGQ